MKRALLCVFLIGLFAQANAADLKILGGLSLSRTTGPITREGGIYLFTPYQEFGAGFVGGGGIEFSLTRNVALEADLLFFQKGSRIAFQLLTEHRTVRIDELSIPILLKIRFRPGSSPYLLAGPEVAFVLTDGAKSLDYGVVGGIGYQKRLEKLGISIEARYHHGLRDLMSEDATPPDVGILMKKMRVFAFVLGFSI